MRVINFNFLQMSFRAQSSQAVSIASSATSFDTSKLLILLFLSKLFKTVITAKYMYQVFCMSLFHSHQNHTHKKRKENTSIL